MGVPTGLPRTSEKYEVIRELGHGGMGVVYLAVDRHLSREIALKVLYEHLYREHAFVERFQEEARSVSGLHHPNIVCVHGLDRTGDALAIDMEYVEGGSLEQLHRSTTMTSHMAAGLAADVLGGLATCHQIGIIHRDIKPSNILVGRDGRAKITDFGLATAYATHLESTIQSNASSGFYMGTPRYMPVQAWEGERPKPFWDLYSFGVVLFELLTGRTAYDGDNPMAIMRKHLVEPLPPVATLTTQLSPQFAALVDDLVASSKRNGGDLDALGAVQRLRETPEFEELRDSNTSATVNLPPPHRAKTRLKRVRRRTAVTLPTLLVAGLAATIVCMAGIWWTLERDGTVQTSVPLERVTPSQPASMAFTRDGSPIVLQVRALDFDDFGNGTWLVTRNAEGEPERITGFTELGLWSLEVGEARESSGMQEVTGSWATVLSLENRITHFGSLNGSLAWDADAGNAILSLRRTRERDGEWVQFTVFGRADPGEQRPEGFYRTLESNPVLQPLIYAELLGRSMNWVTELEGRFPALTGGRVGVPHIVESITPDGQLSEATWTQGEYDASGRIGEVRLPPDTGPPLFVRWTDEHVYIAARVPNAAGAPQLEIGLLPALDTSLDLGGRFFVTILPDGVVRGRYEENGAEKRWSCTWRAGARVTEDGTAAFELEIPIGDFVEHAAPADLRRWRMNARVTNVTGGQGDDALAVWGDSSFQALRHGLLLIFRRSP